MEKCAEGERGLSAIREDTAGRIHRDEYGRSDKVNAPKIRTASFRAATVCASPARTSRSRRLHRGGDLREGFRRSFPGFALQRNLVAAFDKTAALLKIPISIRSDLETGSGYLPLETARCIDPKGSSILRRSSYWAHLMRLTLEMGWKDVHLSLAKL